MTTSFHSKVGIFTPLRLNNYQSRSHRKTNSSDLVLDVGLGRRPELKSDETCDANVIVIDTTSHLCLKPPKQAVQLLAVRPRMPRRRWSQNRRNTAQGRRMGTRTAQCRTGWDRHNTHTQPEPSARRAIHHATRGELQHHIRFQEQAPHTAKTHAGLLGSPHVACCIEHHTLLPTPIPRLSNALHNARMCPATQRRCAASYSSTPERIERSRSLCQHDRRPRTLGFSSTLKESNCMTWQGEAPQRPVSAG